MPQVLCAELVVYDKHSRCLLTEGEYELVLTDSDQLSSGSLAAIAAVAPPPPPPSSASPGDRLTTSPRKNNSSWENIAVDKTDKVGPPGLKF